MATPMPPRIPSATSGPNAFRHRIDTPSLRGVGVQRLFGSQRALKSIEDFTEFEQRAAYFDGDHTRAARKGVNPLERGSQVHFMGEFQNLLDFPPAPKLNVLGRLDPAMTTEAERRGEALFFGKAQCATCHPAPYYTDNLMHNLRTERFYNTVTVNGRTAAADGPIKTFPLRGIKDSPPYLHDDRLITLDDTVEFFNLVLGLKLLPEEKRDLVMFLLALLHGPKESLMRSMVFVTGVVSVLQVAASLAQQSPSSPNEPAHKVYSMTGCLEGGSAAKSVFKLADATSVGQMPPTDPSNTEAGNGLARTRCCQSRVSASRGSIVRRSRAMSAAGWRSRTACGTIDDAVDGNEHVDYNYGQGRAIHSAPVHGGQDQQSARVVSG